MRKPLFRSSSVVVRFGRVVLDGLVVTVVVGFTVVGVMTSADLLDDRVKTLLVVGRVLDHAGRTVRVQQAVRSLDVAVSVADFVLALDIMRVQVFHAVLEVIRSRRVVIVVGVVIVADVTLEVHRRIRIGKSQEGGEHDQLKRHKIIH